MAEKKKREKHRKVDKRHAVKRFTTGLLGEAAIEKLLGIDIIEWNIGLSRNYNHPDIPNYKVGIKTVEYGKFPLIFKKSHDPEIICIVDSEIEGKVYVLGLATVDVLRNFQDDNLILDKYLRARGTKTGFYGFSELKKISVPQDLEPYKKKGYTKEISVEKEETCPKCGSPMVVKNGKFGEFMGCTDFPYCNYTKDV